MRQQHAVRVAGSLLDVYPEQAPIVLEQPQELAALIPEGTKVKTVETVKV